MAPAERDALGSLVMKSGYHVGTPLMTSPPVWLASLVYRALLDSILQRGSTKAYDHGARYMAHLERLEPANGPPPSKN
jgi:hypothetical protein